MVWTLVAVLVVLSIGWYGWGQSTDSYKVSAPALSPTTPAEASGATDVVPSGQTQVNTNPTGVDYQPGRTSTTTKPSTSTTTSSHTSSTTSFTQ